MAAFNNHVAYVRVAVGLVIQNQCVLIAKRHDHQHQGGLWEFPGGKIEAGETALAALKRELKEEVDLDVLVAEPVLTVDHSYPDKTVSLLVFNVTQFKGEARHCEGQALQWLPLNALHTVVVPKANKKIVEYIMTRFDNTADKTQRSV